ncbi:MAG: TonB-dependent receptor domain-containing protein, partial [Dolichospermum sp.]
TVNVGLRQDFSSLVNGSVTSPSVGTKFTVSDSTTLRANYIKNFRVPTIANLFNVNPSNIGNPELKPERGDSFDIGIDQKLGDIGLLRLTTSVIPNTLHAWPEANLGNSILWGNPI